MKKTELNLISELMKNSRRSDRELARALGVSQPTVSRMMKTLEKEGYITEYTAIPDFAKIGFKLLAVILVKWEKPLSEEEFDQMISAGRAVDKIVGMPILMISRGIGSDYDLMIISFHEDYSSYTKLVGELRNLPFLSSANFQGHLTDTTEVSHYRNLTLSAIADHIRRTVKP